MTIPVQQSLAGFIASDADVSFTDAGTVQVRFRVGVEHWRREQDGTFTKLDNSFHDLLISGKTAERAADRFRRGDQFVAHGYVDTRYAEPPARPAEREVYVARRIGHDLARTAYDVDRTPASARQAAQQLRQVEGLAAVGTENGHPSAGAGQVVPPLTPPVADRPASLRPGASPGHGIGL
ncbi:single-stranded DNA-binding protein [Georgenia sp. SYP-B2076]|uniref:single-stranded DNA-binding protein n=1 Tax=Georgenia sp. SYP-B2076 TaxID=2495881 RepID=UPI0013DFCA11|nr:single-stranded DNA-binding protein [Georgenia sp. SYP-B2076]